SALKHHGNRFQPDLDHRPALRGQVRALRLRVGKASIRVAAQSPPLDLTDHGTRPPETPFSLTVQIGDDSGRAVIPCRLGRRGGGPQLNAGARAAGGAILLFLHADVSLPRDAAAWIAGTLAEPDVVAGAFRTRTVPDAGESWLAPLLHLADIRSRITRFPYGDQAIFMRREAFARAGGFPDQPLM